MFLESKCIVRCRVTVLSVTRPKVQLCYTKKNNIISNSLATAQHASGFDTEWVLIEIVYALNVTTIWQRPYHKCSPLRYLYSLPSFLTCSTDVPPELKHWNDEQSELWQSGRWISLCPYRGFRPRGCNYLKMANRKGLQMQKGWKISWHFPSWQWPPRTIFQTLGLGSLRLDVLHCHHHLLYSEHTPDHCPWLDDDAPRIRYFYQYRIHSKGQVQTYPKPGEAGFQKKKWQPSQRFAHSPTYEIGSPGKEVVESQQIL